MSSAMRFSLLPTQPTSTPDGNVAKSSRSWRMEAKNERSMLDDLTTKKEKGDGQSSIQMVETHVGTLTGGTILEDTAMTNSLGPGSLGAPDLYTGVYPTVFVPASRKLPLSRRQFSRDAAQKVGLEVPKRVRGVPRKFPVNPIPYVEKTPPAFISPPYVQKPPSLKCMDGKTAHKDNRSSRGPQTAPCHVPSVSLGVKLATTQIATFTKTTKPQVARRHGTDAKSITQAVESSSSAVENQEKEQPYISMDQKARVIRSYWNVAKLRTQPIESGSSTVEKREEEEPHITVDPKPRATPPRQIDAKLRVLPVESGSPTVKKRMEGSPTAVDPKSRATRPCSIVAELRTQTVESTVKKQEEQKSYIAAESSHHVGRTWRPLPVKSIGLRPLSPSFTRNDQIQRAWVTLHETASSDDAWSAYVTLNEYAVPVPLIILHRVVRLVSRDRPRASTVYNRLLEILKRVRSSGGKVYLFEWNTLIDAAGRGWRKTTVRNYEMALCFFRDMTKGRTPGTTLALDSGSSNVEDGTMAEPLDPDIYTYTTLLGIAARTKDPNCIHHARMLFERSEIPPNRFTHLALVPYFSATSQLGAVRSTLLKLEGDNMELGLDGINALLFAYSKKRRLDVVTMIYRLLKHNLTPNLEDVEEETRRLEKYRHRLRTEEFIVVPGYFVPNEVTYTSLIQIMTYHGHLSTALMIFADMMTAPNTERGACLTSDADGVPRPSPYLPTAAIFRALFLGFRRHAKPLQVSAALQLKKGDEESPDEWTLNNLQRVFDLFMSMPSGVHVGQSALYWLIVAFQTASGNDRELLRDVWRQVEGRFRSSSVGQDNRLHRLKASLFAEET